MLSQDSVPIGKRTNSDASCDPVQLKDWVCPTPGIIDNQGILFVTYTLVFGRYQVPTQVQS